MRPRRSNVGLKGAMKMIIDDGLSSILETEKEVESLVNTARETADMKLKQVKNTLESKLEEAVSAQLRENENALKKATISAEESAGTQRRSSVEQCMKLQNDAMDKMEKAVALVIERIVK